MAVKLPVCIYSTIKLHFTIVWFRFLKGEKPVQEMFSYDFTKPHTTRERERKRGKGNKKLVNNRSSIIEAIIYICMNVKVTMWVCIILWSIFPFQTCTATKTDTKSTPPLLIISITVQALSTKPYFVQALCFISDLRFSFSKTLLLGLFISRIE